MRRRRLRVGPIAPIVAALLPAACGGGRDAGGTAPVALPPAGVARFVIAPPEGAPAWLSDVAFHVVFEGAEPTFCLVEPGLDARLVALPAVETTATGARVLGPVYPYDYGCYEGCPFDVPLLGFERIEVAPVDSDRDGIADRLSGVFTVRASLYDGRELFREPAFVARAEANIEPAFLGTPRLLLPPWERELRTAAAPDEEALYLSFELPSPIESARIVTSAGETPVTVVQASRTPEFRPEGLLPWGETVILVGEAKVGWAGAALEPFAVEVPVLARPTGTWTPSFEAEGLDGLAVTHGTVTSTDAGCGLPALDGERFLLVEGEEFGMVFEVDVPDTEAPALRFEARLAFPGEARRWSPFLDLTATGSGGRVRGEIDGWDGEEIPLAGGPFQAVSPTGTAELPLAAFRGSRAVVRVSFVYWGRPAEPPVDVALQLDGLRVVP